MEGSSIICLPSDDSNKRFVLSKPGKNNLMVVGLNPSTADETGLDPTSTNIDKIARNVGYDGWILVNLYPERCSNPDDLPLEMDESLHWENILLIDRVFSAGKLPVTDVLLAWGNNIDRMGRDYLKKAAYYLFRRLEEYDPQYFCIALTKAGHPMHPSPQAINVNMPGGVDAVMPIPWDFESYALSIKSEFNLSKY